ncbi:hypothetical protein [Microbacterium sp.]|uniref:hypothetical protein n=1 Tax=Microbacterium sp. TaxID=51671 RepID=UPI00281235F6|nr:hypothetical protein [Microbacterium sp.]
MSDSHEQPTSSEPGSREEDRLAGNGSGDPNSDRGFLNDLPPAQDKRLEDSEVDVTDVADDEEDALTTE